MWHRGRPATGFTLIELLVVIVIIGVIAGTAVLAISDSGPRELRSEGRRLLQVLEWATEEAIVRQAQLGVLIDDNGYQLIEWSPTDRRWRALAGEYAPAAVVWSGQLRALVTVQGGPPRKSGGWPQLLFLASGEQTPFRVRLELADRPLPAVTIAGRGDGRLRWQEEGAD